MRDDHSQSNPNPPFAQPPMSMSGSARPATQWVAFRLVGREYAVPVQNVREVLRMVAITPLPEAPPWFVGIVNLRGRALPVIDLRMRLGIAPRPSDLDTPILVVETAGRSVGLIADEVTEVVTLPASAIECPDSLAGRSHPIGAIAHMGDRLLLSLDPDRVCTGSETLSLPDP